MLQKILLVMALISLSLPAYAHDRCYTPEQVNAERLLRLHSELMVIAVACRQSSTGQDLSGAYAGFTKHNINALHEAETTLTNFYKVAYGGKGVDRLDTLRTKLANEYGQQMASESSPVFCGQRRDKVIAYEAQAPSSLADEALRQYATDKTYAPICNEGKGSHETRKKGNV